VGMNRVRLGFGLPGKAETGGAIPATFGKATP
jgi:hypothetical protein